MSIIAEANSLVNGERKEVYEGTDEIITGLWSAYLGIELTVLDYAALMILLKVSRTKDKFHRDSWVDIAGYAEVGPRIWSASQPVSQDFWDDIDQSIRQVTKPRVWDSLYGVPHGVQVKDREGFVWTHKLGLWGFEDERGWAGVEVAANWDGDGPFTEIMDAP